MKQGLLFLFVFTVGLLFSGIVQAEPPAPATTQYIFLESITLPLELDWERADGEEGVPEAQSYYFEIIDVVSPVLVTESSISTVPIGSLTALMPQHEYQWYVDTCKKKSGGKDCSDSTLELFIEKEMSFTWRVISCVDKDGTVCEESSYKRGFTSPILPTPDNSIDNDSPIVLDWEGIKEAQSYYFEIFDWEDIESVTLPPELNWDGALEAQSYYFEIIDVVSPVLVTESSISTVPIGSLTALMPQHEYWWYQNNYAVACQENREKKMADLGEPEETYDGSSCNEYQLESYVIEKDLTHEWRVSSCTNSDGTDCGSYNIPSWKFQYLLSAPDMISPLGLKNEKNYLPITLDWEDVTGAGSYIINWGPAPPWFKDIGSEPLAILIPPQDGVLQSEYDDTRDCLFTKTDIIDRYTWEIATCLDELGNLCSPVFSVVNAFDTQKGSFVLGKVELRQPLYIQFFEDDPNPTEQVGKVPNVLKTDFLEWNGPACAHLYEIEITPEGGGGSITFNTRDAQTTNIQLAGEGDDIAVLKTFWANPKNLNKIFEWTATPCWSAFLIDSGITGNCEDSGKSDAWKFKTTVGTPELISPINNISTRIPVMLSWEKAIGAVSYKYEIIEANSGFDNDTSTNAMAYGAVSGRNVTVGYSAGKIIPNRSYKWRVQSCVDTNIETDIETIDKKVCGDWSSSGEFTAYDLLAPTDLTPVNGGEMFITSNVSWTKDDTANAYQYNLEYFCIDEYEDIEECLAYEIPICGDSQSLNIGKTSSLAEEKVTTLNRFPLPINCMGEYRFQVRSCIDEKCEELTAPENMSDAELFSFTTLQPPAGPGIVPCGRNADNLGTPYNEREACQIKHVGFLIQNILDFVVWRLSLLILAGLLVLRVASIYLSFGSPTIVANIKTTLRGFLLGLSVLLFAWILINLIMGFLGFQIQFFGIWWELPF